MTKLKDLLQNTKDQGKIIISLGVYDGMSARYLRKIYEECKANGTLAESIGGIVPIVSGYLTSATLGFPDMGIINSDSIERQTRIVKQAIGNIPIGSDMDTGFGNEPSAIYNAALKIHSAGASYIQLEDQAGDKTCGHMEGSTGSGKKVISAEEYVHLRLNPIKEYRKTVDDFLIMARTDSRTAGEFLNNNQDKGLDEAIRRLNIYRDNGADLLFIESPLSDQEMLRITKEFNNLNNQYLVANMIEGSPKTPYHTVNEIRDMGFNFVYYCIGSIFASCYGNGGIDSYFRTVLQGRNPVNEGIIPNDSFNRFNEFIGKTNFENFNKKFHDEYKSSLKDCLDK
jgi:2,3-dimethylmalate lyase